MTARVLALLVVVGLLTPFALRAWLETHQPRRVVGGNK